MVSIKRCVSCLVPSASVGSEFHHFILYQPLMLLQNVKLVYVFNFVFLWNVFNWFDHNLWGLELGFDLECILEEVANAWSRNCVLYV